VNARSKCAIAAAAVVDDDGDNNDDSYFDSAPKKCINRE
jgi:hypothetical protein